MNWNTYQEQDLQGERQYGHYAGEPQRLHYANEQEHNEKQSGYYQPGQNFQFVVYIQPQPFVSGQSLNLGSIAAILSYAGGWFTGLFFFLFAGQNRYVRFHALQSLIFFGAINVLDIALFNLSMFERFHLPYITHTITTIAFFSFFLLNIMAFFGWLIAMIQAARGRYYKMPFAGNFAERCLSRGTILK
jgi:uncharacterized membrane protein